MNGRTVTSAAPARYCIATRSLHYFPHPAAGCKQPVAAGQHLKRAVLGNVFHTGSTNRCPARRSSTVRVHAWVDSQTHAQPDADVKRPADLTQALAVAGFLAVRYGSAQIDAHLILKSLAALQLLVAAVAMTFRNVHADRVTGVTAPCALALHALNYTRIPFMTSLTALFGYNLSEKLPGPYYLWFASLAAALYYGYGSYWYTAAISVLAGWSLIQNRGPVQSLASIATIGVSAYVVYQEATVLWVMILIAAQLVHSGLRTVLSPLGIAV